MYKIYLVEDESAVRNAIRDRIAWEEAGFVFSGEAPDGEVALREICELQPDLVITDIRMPFMDGLSLSGKLKELFPRIRIVILTGHDDFEYARQAISCGVSDYLLKPLSADALLETLKKIHHHMDEERTLMLKAKELEQFREEEFFRALCEGRISGKSIESEAEGYGLSIRNSSALVLIIKPLFPDYEKEHGEESFRSRVDKYLTWLTADAPDYCYFVYAPGYYAIIIRNSKRSLLDERAFLFASAIQEQLNALFDLPVAISIGKSISALDMISESCHEAIALLREDLYYNRILFREHEESRYTLIAERCKELVSQNFSDTDLSLSTVAAELAVSPGRLSTLFHQETGERFISFLNRYRLEKSAELLTATDLPVAAIAEACGYNQPHYFSSLFKRYYGISPLAYRQEKG